MSTKMEMLVGTVVGLTVSALACWPTLAPVAPLFTLVGGGILGKFWGESPQHRELKKKMSSYPPGPGDDEVTPVDNPKKRKPPRTTTLCVFAVMLVGCVGGAPLPPPATGWPDVAQCGPEPEEVIGDVSGVLLENVKNGGSQADLEQMLWDIAAKLGDAGGETVVCAVQRLLDRWTAPGAAQEPIRTQMSGQAGEFLRNVNVEIQHVPMSRREESPTMMFALISATEVVSQAQLERIAEAAEVNAAHCADAWGKRRPAIEVASREQQLPDGCHPIVFFGKSSEKGVLAEHWWDPVRLGPAGRVYAEEGSGLNTGLYSMTEACCHEVLEALINPRLTDWAIHPTRPGLWVPKEVCDPPQTHYFVNVGGKQWRVANFVHPEWFDSTYATPENAQAFLSRGGRFDHNREFTKAGQVGPEGYVILSDGSGRTWTEGANGAMPMAKSAQQILARQHWLARTKLITKLRARLSIRQNFS